MTVKDAFMGEEVNWKKMLLLFWQKIWIIAIAGVAGAVIGSSLYLLIAVVFSGPLQYKIDGGFYIDFADGVLDAHDYYNAYTWNSVVHQDKIMELTMETLKNAGVTNLDKEYVSDSIQADILSDVRYLTLTVTCDYPEYATQIFDACEYAIIQFGQDMEEFDEITVTHQSEPKAIVIPVMTWRATVIGCTISIILAMIWLIIINLVDDSIYLQEELHDRYNLFVFGSIPEYRKKKNETDEEWEKYCAQECINHLSYKLHKGDRIAFIPVVDLVNCSRPISISLLTNIDDIEINNCVMPRNAEEFEQLRGYSGVILGVPYGCRNGRLLRKYMDDLQKQDCRIVGAILIEADGTFQRKYYRTCFQKG